MIYDDYEVVGETSVHEASRELINTPLWDTFTLRQDFVGSPHAATYMIPLRGASTWLKSYLPEAKRHQTFLAQQLPHTRALVNRVLAGLPIKEVGNVMAVRLAPWAKVKPHIDEGEYPAKFERFHIVVDTRGAWYEVAGKRYYPRDGEIFFFNHRVTHSAGNPTPHPRTHIIIDATLKE